MGKLASDCVFSIPLAVGKQGSGSGQDSGRTERKRILLVDDNRLVIETTRELFEAFGFAVNVAHTTDDALEEFKRNHLEFCVAVLDYMLPGMPVSQLAKELKQIDSDVKLMLFSGYPERLLQSELSSEARGYIDGYVSKPFSPMDLREKIGSLM